MKRDYIVFIRILLVIILAFITAILITIVRNGKDTLLKEFKSIYDLSGRRVEVPLYVDSIVCIKASAIRMVVYAGGADRICGVEECELRGDPYTHLYAYPLLRTKPSIGPMMGGDAELIVMANPDVIFSTCITPSEANALQRRTGIPVVVLDYGDLGNNRASFNQSLRVIGQVLGTEERVNRLINYIENQIEELRIRREKFVPSTALQNLEKELYVCGISYKGRRGLTSTDPYYPALKFLGVKNVASNVSSKIISPINGTIVNLEQIALWNPSIIFVDHDGLELVKRDLRRVMPDRVKLFLIWPYNNVHSNFEIMLINSWYMGQTLFPDAFKDIDITEKRNEILMAFLNRPIADSMLQVWGEYRIINSYGEQCNN